MRKRAAVLFVMTTPALLRQWRRRARESRMSLRAWVEHSLGNAPVLEPTAAPMRDRTTSVPSKQLLGKGR